MPIGTPLLPADDDAAKIAAAPVPASDSSQQPVPESATKHGTGASAGHRFVCFLRRGAHFGAGIFAMICLAVLDRYAMWCNAAATTSTCLPSLTFEFRVFFYLSVFFHFQCFLDWKRAPEGIEQFTPIAHARFCVFMAACWTAVIQIAFYTSNYGFLSFVRVASQMLFLFLSVNTSPNIVYAMACFIMACFLLLNRTTDLGIILLFGMCSATYFVPRAMLDGSVRAIPLYIAVALLVIAS